MNNQKKQGCRGEKTITTEAEAHSYCAKFNYNSRISMSVQEHRVLFRWIYISRAHTSLPDIMQLSGKVSNEMSALMFAKHTGRWGSPGPFSSNPYSKSVIFN